MSSFNAARHYKFVSSKDVEVTMLRGDGAPKMTGGGGTWTIVPRPRRVGITQWTGRDPYQMDVPVMFDGLAEGDSGLEQDIAKLNQMQMSPGDNTPPPTLHIVGAVPIKGATWIISSIDWGDNVIYRAEGEGGYRLRQDAVVHLTQYVPEDRLSVSKAGPPAKSYKWKKGDTLASVAHKQHSTQVLIKNANAQIRDWKKVKVGTTIRIPPKPSSGK